MSAAARAEARKRAILSRGSDRLAKLTTSARGDDPAYMHDNPPLPSFSTGRNFVGEESFMPTPPSRQSPSPSPRAPAAASKSPSPGPNPLFSPGQGFNVNASPDPSVWSPEQQQQFMQALMNASPLSRSPESLPGLTPTDVDPSLPPLDNPLAALLFPQGAGAGSDGGAGFGGAGGFPPMGPLGAPGKAPFGAAPAPPPTRLQKLMPFVHLVTMWSMLAYFVLYREPQSFAEKTGSVVDPGGAGSGGIWARWAELGRRSPLGDTAQFLQIQIVVRAVELALRDQNRSFIVLFSGWLAA
ncbi:hypothetical protein DXG03_009590 [Asterophora parasitica]|uniref:Uncharacterized protein n=1 Tax=Asterophora parasitica TaxID=117018 RepID=A0A9P7KC61_9AGAR|nr:hypothetical protein DXG03_009590 [Asterophora parasitica]